ncbi:ClpP/crotonase-like domain protein [Vibrio phage 1.084.O._10N.261.49.F5]|nr:ClpP/crotonase-like domain protein [Vibrio phage 1.084.O._10N.261.49.F5]
MGVLKTLSRRFLEEPQLIIQSEFQKIAEILDMQHGRKGLETLFPKTSLQDKIKEKMEDPFYTGYKFDSETSSEESPKNYGVIKVEGALSYKPITEACAPETCNYQELVKETSKLVSEGKDTIYFIHDSGGGEAYNMMETASEIRKLADDNSVKLIGYVDGMSASASYGLLSICHEIIANPDARVGSVGVVVSLMNNSGALEKAGYKRSFITAGANKVPFDEEGEFTDNFKTSIQEDVDTLYEQFTTHVSKYRESMSVKDVKDTEANVFRAEEALKLGLIDKVMTVSAFKKEYLENYEPQEVSSKTANKVEKMTDVVDTEKFAAMEAELAALREFQANAVLQTKKDSISAKLASADFLTNKEELVAHLASSSESENTMILSVIEQCTSKTASMQEEIVKMTKDHEGAITTLNTTITDMKTSHESFKEEFAKPEAIKGVVDEKELSFEEKKARAVAEYKAKQSL